MSHLADFAAWAVVAVAFLMVLRGVALWIWGKVLGKGWW